MFESFFRNVKSADRRRKNAPKSSILRLEPLEERELLDAAPISTIITSENCAALLSDDAPDLFDLSPDPIPTTAAVKTWIVSSTADDLSVEGTLRHAIANAADGDAVTFADALKGKTITLNGSALAVSNTITIDASNLWDAVANAPGLTVDADGKSSVLASHADVTLIGLKFINGAANVGGGLSIQANALLKSCVVSNNNAVHSGGGVYVFGDATFENCEIAVNYISASSETRLAYIYGGGVYIGGYATFENCKVSHNTVSASFVNYRGSAVLGGGVCAWTGATFENCEVSHNSISVSSESKYTSVYGGGVWVSGDGNATFENCKISQNSVSASSESSRIEASGGGVYAHGATFENCEISANSNSANGDENAFAYGGGVYIDWKSSLFRSCTISGNTCFANGDSYGGGVYADNTANTTIFYNSILALNEAKTGNDFDGLNEYAQAYCTLSSKLDWSNASEPGVVNYLYDPSKPLFQDPSRGNYRLAADSQAIDLGNSEYLLESSTFDLDGSDRVIGQEVDLGAYESPYGISASQSKVYSDKVPIKAMFSAEIATAKLFWIADGISQTLGTIADGEEFVWDTTQFADASGVLRAEYIDSSGKVKRTIDVEGVILNASNVVVKRGEIAENESWTSDKIYVVVGKLTIDANASVTIGAGTTVKFVSGGYLNLASGASASVVSGATLTRFEDDSVGGDTNLDGATSIPKFGAPYLRGDLSKTTIDPNATIKYVAPTCSGTLAQNETWRGGQVYHVTGDLTIPSGVELTIMPGAIVKFDAGKSLVVQSGGKLIAKGNAAQPIVFTSILDDAYGGDTNEDSNNSAPSVGAWRQILVQGTAEFDHAIVRYSGSNTDNSSDGAIFASGSGAKVEFNNGEIAHSLVAALHCNYSDSSQLIVRNAVVYDAKYATHCGDYVNCVFDSVDSLCNTNYYYSKASRYANCIISNVRTINTYSAYAFNNCVFWNPQGFGSQTFSEVGKNGNIWANPLFRDAENGDYRLTAGSPCIDAGDGSAAPETDRLGVPRFDDPYVANTGTATSSGAYADVGAYEFVDGATSNLDLEPISIMTAPTAEPGGELTVQWTLRNNGSVEIDGSWRDAFYLITEQGERVFIQEVAQNALIKCGDAQTFQTTLRLPTVVEGEYRVEIQTNSDRAIFEGANNENNALVSAIPVAIAAPEAALPIEELALAKGEERAFKLVVAPGETFYLVADSENLTIRARENYAPTAALFDLKSASNDGKTHVQFEAADAERVFYLVISSETEQTVALSKEDAVATPEVAPDQGYDLTNVTTTLDCPVTRVGRVACARVVVVNNGDYPVYAPQVVLMSQTGRRMAWTREGLESNPSNVLTALALSNNGDIGTLKAGESIAIPFYYVYESGMRITAQLYQASGESVYASSEDALWSLYSDYSEAMRDAAQTFAHRGKLERDLATLEAFARAQIAGEDCVGLSGSIVTEGAGTPVAGQIVVATWSTLNDDGEEEERVALATTDANGFFYFDYLPAVESLTLRVDSDEIELTFDLSDGNDVVGVVVPVAPKLALAGRVRDELNAVKADVVVKAAEANGRTFFTTTDALGQYAFADLFAGEWTISLVGDGVYENVDSKVLTLNQPATTLDFIVAPNMNAVGVVVDEAEVGVGDLTLFLYDGTSFVGEAITEGNGSFEFENVPSGFYNLRIYSNVGELMQIARVSIEQGEELRVELKAPTVGSRFGRVLFSNGLPAVGLPVAFESDFGQKQTVVDANGFYRFDDVVQAPYRLRIGGVDAQFDFDWTDESAEQNADVSIPYASSLTILVADADGEPYANASISVEEDGETFAFAADENGSCALLFTSAGERTIWASGSKGATAVERVQIADGVNEWRGRCGTSTLRISSSGLTENESDLFVWSLQLIDADGAERGIATGVRDSISTFDVKGLPSGSYRLNASCGRMIASANFELQTGATKSLALNFTDSQCCEVVVQIELPSDFDGDLSGAELFVYDADNNLVWYDGQLSQEESALVRLMESGAYSFVILCGEYVAETRVDVGGAQSSATVALQKGLVEISGVLAIAGADDAWATVSCRDADGRILGSARAAEDGTFHFATTADGAGTIVVEINGKESRVVACETRIGKNDVGTIDVEIDGQTDSATIRCVDSTFVGSYVDEFSDSLIDFSNYLAFPFTKLQYSNLVNRYADLSSQLSKFKPLRAHCKCDQAQVANYNNELHSILQQMQEVDQQLTSLNDLEQEQRSLVRGVLLDVASCAANFIPVGWAAIGLQLGVGITQLGVSIYEYTHAMKDFHDAGDLFFDGANIIDNIGISLNDAAQTLRRGAQTVFDTVEEFGKRCAQLIRPNTLNLETIQEIAEAASRIGRELKAQEEALMAALMRPLSSNTRNIVGNAYWNNISQQHNIETLRRAAEAQRRVAEAQSKVATRIANCVKTLFRVIDFVQLGMDARELIQNVREHTRLADAIDQTLYGLSNDEYHSVNELEFWRKYAKCNCFYCRCDKPVCNCLSDGVCVDGAYCKCGCKSEKKPKDPPESTDPNEIMGPTGADFVWHDAGTEDEPYMVIDGANWTNETTQRFAINFENKPDATAAAQEVFVDMTLPDAFDAETLTLSAVNVGDEIFQLTPEYQIAENVWLFDQASTGDRLKITFNFDPETRVASWYLRSYVVSTIDHFPASAYAGFLPPNDKLLGNGQGGVSFSVSLKEDVASGARVETYATIVFDVNDPIDTNVWVNTLDLAAPTAEILSTTYNATTQTIDVAWSGADAESGVVSYDVYYSTDGGAFYNLWLSETTATSGSFGFEDDGEYVFKVVAFDAVGHSSEGVVARIAVESTGPTIRLDASTYLVQEGCDVLVSALESTGEDLTYLWNLSNSEFDSLDDYVEGAPEIWLSTRAQGFGEGEYAIRLRVRDASGIYSKPTRATLVVERVAPSFAVDATTLNDGQILSLSIASNAPFDAPIAQWRVHWGDGETTTVDALGDAIVVGHVYALTDAAYNVQLEAIDAQGRGEGEFYDLLAHIVGRLENAVAALQTATQDAANALDDGNRTAAAESASCCRSHDAPAREPAATPCCCSNETIPVEFDDDELASVEPTFATLERVVELFDSAFAVHGATPAATAWRVADYEVAIAPDAPAPAPAPERAQALAAYASEESIDVAQTLAETFEDEWTFDACEALLDLDPFEFEF